MDYSYIFSEGSPSYGVAVISGYDAIADIPTQEDYGYFAYLFSGT